MCCKQAEIMLAIYYAIKALFICSMLKIKCAKTFQYLYFNIPPLYKIKQYLKKICVGYFKILVKGFCPHFKGFFSQSYHSWRCGILRLRSYGTVQKITLTPRRSLIIVYNEALTIIECELNLLYKSCRMFK